MLSPNQKPCEAARKPQNYSYGKSLHARVKKKKKKILSIRWGKPKLARCFFIMTIPLVAKALALIMVGKLIHP